MTSTFTVQLGAEVKAQVVDAAPLPWTPRFTLASTSLKVGGYASADEHEVHVLSTVGSGSWYGPECDELRFGRQTGLLESLWLRVPDADTDPDLATPWADLPHQTGLLRIQDVRPFTVDHAAVRCYSPQVLVCLRAEIATNEAERLRIRVGDGVDLLFADRRLTGWCVERPERFLTSAWEFPDPEPEDPALAELLGGYLSVVARPRGEGLLDGDPALLEALRDLDRRTDLRRGARERRRVLHETIEEVVDFFYT